MSSTFKKIASILLVLIMVLAMMTGCAGSAEPAADDAAPADDAAAAPASDDPDDPLNANIDWRQFEGTTLRFVMTTHWFQAAIDEMLPEFEELTGITVETENYAENEFWNKLLVEFNSNTGIDAYMLNVTNVATYNSGGWVEELTPYLENTELTDAAWYDYEDFFPSALDFGAYEGGQYGLPVTGEWQILFYREDIYEEHGLTVPTTMDQLYDNAKYIQDNVDGVAGITLRGARGSALWWPWGGFVRTYGSYWLDPNGVCTLDSAEAVAATEMYAKLCTECGPAGIASYTYYEALTDFQAGTSGHFVDSSGFMGNVEDAENSAVAGKVGYAAMPGAAEGQPAVPNMNHWMVAMGTQSANKDATWLLLQWITCKQTHLDIAIANGSACRTTTWEDPSYTSLYPEDWAQASLDSAAYAENAIPVVPEASEMGELIEIAVTSLYEGGDATAVCGQLAADCNALLG